LAKEYIPQTNAPIVLNATVEQSYNLLKNNELLNRNSIYITSTAKTIREMSPFESYLNYSSLNSLINVDSSYTDDELINDGFTKININEDEEGTSSYKDNNVNTKFLVKISPGNNYFSLFVATPKTT
jgi:hypothetical protein